MSYPGVCRNILDARHKKDGYGTYTNPKRFLNQDYLQLKKYLAIRHTKYLDEMFPPDKNSIGRDVLSFSNMARVVWKRPNEIVSKPSFVVDGVSRFDFGQGVIGDCWFLASIGALTFQEAILEQVVPLEQTFDEDYCGIFHFRFWRFGKWVDVVIDDKLPTINNKLIFVRSKDPNEFWPALLEKAYAKVCGSYSDMNAGTPTEAMVDFTGGVHMCINLTDPPSDLWELMVRATNATSLMSCGTPQGETAANTVLPNGVVQGHAYTVTGVHEMMRGGRPLHLVRLWNPWGETEWNGAWSDNSSLWQTVSPKDREICLTGIDDGEFWMSLEDFMKFYKDLDICCLCPDFLDGGSSCHWQTSVHEGRWLAGTTAGGCPNNYDTFWTNPQYRIEIGQLRSDCSKNQGENNMLLSLMQIPDKRNRRLVQNLHIGLSIFEVTEEYKALKGKFPASFFNRPVAQTKSYMNSREVMEFIGLKPGEYVIVPSTFNPYETASFILTVVSKTETHVHGHSGHHNHNHGEIEEPVPTDNGKDDEKKRDVFLEFSDKNEEVDAEKLQMILNDRILKGDLKSGGFSLDACRSIVALMDYLNIGFKTSITGKLNGLEFLRLWNKVVTYKDIFFSSDVSRTGMLSLKELKNAIVASGMRVSDDMLNLMSLRYGTSSGHITLENFIVLVLRFYCMYKIYTQLSSGSVISLRESEWMYLSIYT